MSHNVQGGVCAMLTGVGLVIALAAAALSAAEIQPRDVLLRARGVATAMARDDVKVWLLLEIAAAQRRAGDRANAIATLQKALLSALLLEGNARNDAVVEVAEEWARAGDIDLALRAADLTWREDLQDLVRSGVVAVQTEMGDIPAALQTARRASTAILSAELLAQIAAAQARAGNYAGGRSILQEALQTAATITEDREKFAALQDIAVAQAAVGDVPASLHTAAAILDPGRKDLALESIAMTQARIKDIPGAFQTAGHIQDARYKVSSFRGIGKIQAQGGDVQGALQTAATIQDDLAKAWVLREVVAAQARASQLPQALQTAAEIKGEAVQAEALRAIAAIQVTAGDIQGAFKTVAMIPTTSLTSSAGKDQTLREMAAGQAARGDMAGALRTAASIAQDEDFIQSWAFRDIAVAQAAAGDIQGGFQTVAMIQDARVDHFFRGAAARWVVAAQTRQGHVKAALQWADQQRSPVLKAFGLLGVAEGIMERQGAGKPRDNICRRGLAGEWASPFIVC